MTYFRSEALVKKEIPEPDIDNNTSTDQTTEPAIFDQSEHHMSLNETASLKIIQQQLSDFASNNLLTDRLKSIVNAASTPKSNVIPTKRPNSATPQPIISSLSALWASDTSLLEKAASQSPASTFAIDALNEADFGLPLAKKPKVKISLSSESDPDANAIILKLEESPAVSKSSATNGLARSLPTFTKSNLSGASSSPNIVSGLLAATAASVVENAWVSGPTTAIEELFPETINRLLNMQANTTDRIFDFQITFGSKHCYANSAMLIQRFMSNGYTVQSIKDDTACRLKIYTFVNHTGDSELCAAGADIGSK